MLAPSITFTRPIDAAPPPSRRTCTGLWHAARPGDRLRHGSTLPAMMLMARIRCFGPLLVVAAATATCAGAAELNDYPTAARADYVFACMKTNGDTRHALEQCSCSNDVIASALPYDRYVAAEAVLSLSQVPGRFGGMFRSPEQARAATNDPRRAQAEAEVRCF